MALLKGFPPSNTITPGYIGPQTTTAAATNKKTVDDLIDGFFNNTLSDEDYGQLYDVLKDKKRPTVAEKEEPTEKTPKVLSVEAGNNDSCEMKLSNDVVLKFSKENPSLPENLDPNRTVNISLDNLMQLWAHAAYIRQRDVKDLKNRLDFAEEKTRFINKSSKKMLVMGMALGKQK